MEWDVEKLSNSKWTKKIMGIVLLLLVALLSFNKISVVTSSPESEKHFKLFILTKLVLRRYK